MKDLFSKDGKPVRILNLSLTKEWYEKILFGEKTEEYRAIKIHWASRLIKPEAPHRAEVLSMIKNNTLNAAYFLVGYMGCSIAEDGSADQFNAEYKEHRWQNVLVPYTHVAFRNGYPEDGAPVVIREIEDIVVSKPKRGMCPEEWLREFFFTIKFKPTDAEDLSTFHSNQEIFRLHRDERVSYKGEDIGASLAGYTEDGHYLILGFGEDDKGCIKTFTDNKNVLHVSHDYRSYRFAKAKYVRPME